MNPNPPLTPEILVTRTGEYLVQRGFINTEQLRHALDVQSNLRASGKSILIGQVLIDLGMIDRPTLDMAITEQILKLKTALQETNQQLERRVQERTMELQNALKKLSELNQLKSNIIANVSHELRTPMTHIKGYLELLATETLGPVNTDQAEALSVMQRSSDRLESLIEDMISFSLASKGEFTLRLATIDIAQICRNQLSRASAAIEKAGLTVKTVLPTTLSKARADEEKISWVVSQLLDNAIKFTPTNGHLTVSARMDGDFIKVAVTDSGIGIPKDKIGEIFEPFQQVDGTSTRRYGGTGLGLALVRQIIEAHGSIIRVYSRVGQGSRFEFLLPCKNEAA